MWHDGGLQPPQIVREATDAYLEAEDAIAEWIEECCDVDPSKTGTTADLFQSWSQCAEKAGEHPGTKIRFSLTLEARGFQRARIGGTGQRAFKGIDTKPVAGRDYDDGYN